ncbi:sulfotransferase [Maritimibacter sp. UBA3975]|uniref:sulfotransferase family protein n=1 Tax=Maritimibacter sp. UBA3975 TaxID=1946833 RepID=UPI0025B9F77A|nr:sulfotransferase [Maritimibacter sp. UBA3975]|tara:strand:+ start:2787 stop:3908 length:1122 start_codon:yes stop_codon:yes gene_type:complete
MTDTPDTLRPLLARAETALNAGRFDDMHAALDAAFAIDPGCLAGLWTYTYGTRFAAHDAVLERIESYARQPGLAPPLRAQLLFMRAKALDDLGRHAETFEVVLEANETKGATFDTPAITALTHRLITAVRAAPDIRLNAQGPRMIFVLGMPRSGTSLIAQMLGAHPAITNLGERVALGPALERRQTGANPHLAFLDGIDQARLETARARYLDGVPEAGIFVDKMPENYLFAWAIPMLFPDALILHMRRDRLATCWSCYKNDFREGHRYSYDWADLTAQYDRHLNLCALGRERAGEAWHEVSLDRLTAHPEQVLTPILAALGLSWDAACAAPERAGGAMPTLSKWQVRQGIDPAMAQGWRAYEPMIRARLEGAR